MGLSSAHTTTVRFTQPALSPAHPVTSAFQSANLSPAHPMASNGAISLSQQHPMASNGAISLSPALAREVEIINGGIDGRQFGIREIPPDRLEAESLTALEIADDAGLTDKFNDGAVTPVKLDRAYVEQPFIDAIGIALSVDLTAIGVTNIVTVPGGETYHIVGALVECDAAANVDSPATCGIGVAAGEDDLFDSQSLVGLVSAGKVFRFITLESIIATAGQTIKFGVDIVATGVGATTQTADIYLLGFKV